MPNNLTNAEEARLLGISVDNTLLALFTADPGEAGSLVNELAGGSYARQPFVPDETTTPITNDGAITFPKATANQGTATHMGLIAAPGEDDAGTVRWHGPIKDSDGNDASIPVHIDVTVVFEDGTIAVSMD